MIILRMTDEQRALLAAVPAQDHSKGLLYIPGRLLVCEESADEDAKEFMAKFIEALCAPIENEDA